MYSIFRLLSFLSGILPCFSVYRFLLFYLIVMLVFPADCEIRIAGAARINRDHRVNSLQRGQCALYIGIASRFRDSEREPRRRDAGRVENAGMEDCTERELESSFQRDRMGNEVAVKFSFPRDIVISHPLLFLSSFATLRPFFKIFFATLNSAMLPKRISDDSSYTLALSARITMYPMALLATPFSSPGFPRKRDRRPPASVWTRNKGFATTAPLRKISSFVLHALDVSS